MSEETKEIVDTSSIDSRITGLAKQILDEPDPDKAKQAVALFNWNISKKNTTRILKLNDLYDDVTDQMVLRFKTKSDQFSNSDLLDYMKAVQGAIDTSTKNLAQIEEPPTIVQQNNTQVNINVVDGFDRDARERILAAIQQTMRGAKTAPVIEAEPAVIVTEPVIVSEAETQPTIVVDESIEELNSIVENRKETQE